MRQRQYLRLVLPFVLSLNILLIYTCFTTVSQAPVALAHAFVIGSDPVDGSTINIAPSMVRIYFDTSISPVSVAHVYAFTPGEHEVDAAHSFISSSNPRELDTPLIPPAQLPQGSYEIRWTALANDDGHATSGLIGFNLGFAPLPGTPILGPSTSNYLPQLDLLGMISVAWEWLVLMALTVWVGILIAEGLLLERGERHAALLMRTRKQSHSLQWLCLLALLVGEVVTLALRAAQLTQSLNGAGIDFVALHHLMLETNYGDLWLVRIVLIVIALGVLRWTTRKPGNTKRTSLARMTGSSFSQMRQRITQEQNIPKEAREAGVSTAAFVPLSRRYTAIHLILAGLLLFTLALTGDAAQLAQPHISSIVLDWLYLTARCIWFGGFAYLGYVLLPLLPLVEPDHHAEMLSTLLRRFHPLMLAAPGVLLVSGLYLSEVSISNLHQFLSDPYGRTLLIAYLLIALMLILSIYTLFILRPKLTRQAVLLPVVDAELPARRTRRSALEQTERRIKRTMVILSWLGAGVLLCAALMAFFAPPIVFPAINYTSNTNVTTTSPPSSALHAQTKQVGNLSVTLQLLPGRVDYANIVIITIYDSTGKPVTDAQVELTTNMQLMDMGTSHATIKGGNPGYFATFARNTAFSMNGLWNITVKIQRPNQAPVETVFPVTLGES